MLEIKRWEKAKEKQKKFMNQYVEMICDDIRENLDSIERDFYFGYHEKDENLFVSVWDDVEEKGPLLTEEEYKRIVDHYVTLIRDYVLNELEDMRDLKCRGFTDFLRLDEEIAEYEEAHG